MKTESTWHWHWVRVTDRNEVVMGGWGTEELCHTTVKHVVSLLPVIIRTTENEPPEVVVLDKEIS